MIANSKEFVYDSKAKHKTYKAVIAKPPRRIFKYKTQNPLMKNIANTKGENNVHKVISQSETVQKKERQIIKYAEILRAVVTLQRKFREKQLQKYFIKDRYGKIRAPQQVRRITRLTEDEVGKIKEKFERKSWDQDEEYYEEVEEVEADQLNERGTRGTDVREKVTFVN